MDAVVHSSEFDGYVGNKSAWGFFRGFHDYAEKGRGDGEERCDCIASIFSVSLLADVYEALLFVFCERCSWGVGGMDGMDAVRQAR